MKSKKIIIVYSGAKHQGGIERYLENLFAFYDKKKMKLVLVSIGEWPLCEKVRRKGGKIVVLSGARINLKTFSDIANTSKKENANLIVSQGVVANFYARRASKIAGIPHLTTVHSDLKSDYSNTLIRFLYSLSDRVSRKVTTRYITVSEFLKRELVKSGVSKDKISVIYNGVRLKDTSHKIQVTKEMGGEIVIGSIGRLHRVKGYENLIRAFAQMSPIGIRLIIWGEGQERENLEKLIVDLGLKEKVELAGYTENIEEVLSDVDIYVQPSLVEGFGLTVVEAMMAGKPVIVTPVGSLKEIVTDGKNGIVTKSKTSKSLARTIENLLSDTELLTKVRDNAPQDAREKFSMERWIEETEKVYKETAK